MSGAPGPVATAGAAVDDAARRLRAAGVDRPRLDARLLVAHALGVESGAVLAHPERRLDARQRAAFAALVRRRARREPVARLVGRREFWSLDFEVTTEVFDPRPATETVVEAALAGLPERGAPLDVLDLGTGTGCLLLALLSELPAARGVGVDASAAAVTVARRNAFALGLAGRTGFLVGDWGRGLKGRFGLIVANPPYIVAEEIEALAPEIVRFEPRPALDGGADGLDRYREIAPDLARLLVPGGRAALEIGAGQAPAVAAILAGHGLAVRELREDLAGVVRCIIATLDGQRCGQ